MDLVSPLQVKATKSPHRNQIQRLSQKPMLSQSPAGTKIYVSISKASMNDFKTIKAACMGNCQEKQTKKKKKPRIILGNL